MGGPFSKWTEKQVLVQRRNYMKEVLFICLFVYLIWRGRLGLQTKYLFLEQQQVLRGEAVNTFGLGLKVI